MIAWIKQKWGWFLTALILVSLDVWHKDVFFSIFFAYGLIIKFISSDYLSPKWKKYFATTIWSSVLVLVGLTLYVNYYMPHGPIYPTDFVICQNDDRGPCSEQYVEDLRNVDIPNWAKFLRRSEGGLLLYGLLILGMVVNGATNRNQEE